MIDTKTNWVDRVMSIGTVIADAHSFAPVDSKYHILPIECQVGEMYEDTLFIETPVTPILCTRAEVIADLKRRFDAYSVHSIFAYNACFDRNHLPELGYLERNNPPPVREMAHKVDQLRAPLKTRGKIILPLGFYNFTPQKMSDRLTCRTFLCT